MNRVKYSRKQKKSKNLIEEFKNHVGEDKFNQLVTYMTENDILKYFIDADIDTFFKNGIQYGILDVIKFLYECKRYEYNYEWLNGGVNVGLNIKQTEERDQSMAMAAPILTGTSGSESCGQVWDLYSKNRAATINYLIDMKKYSNVRINKKKFYYKLSEKYKFC